MSRRNYVFLEPPDNSFTIEFSSDNSGVARACKVVVNVENGRLSITATGCDDRASILLDEEVEIPDEDNDS